MPTPSARYAFDPSLVALGEAIRRERLARGISQEELAHLAGIDRSHMGSIERAKQNPTFISLVRIAGAMKMTVADLVASANV